jgi:hypothetical protein
MHNKDVIFAANVQSVEITKFTTFLNALLSVADETTALGNSIETWRINSVSSTLRISCRAADGVGESSQKCDGDLYDVQSYWDIHTSGGHHRALRTAAIASLNVNSDLVCSRMDGRSGSVQAVGPDCLERRLRGPALDEPSEDLGWSGVEVGL